MQVNLADETERTPVLSDPTSSHSSSTSNSFMSDSVPLSHPPPPPPGSGGGVVLMTASSTPQLKSASSQSVNGGELTPGSTLMSPFAPTHVVGTAVGAHVAQAPSYDWQQQQQQQSTAQQMTPQQSMTPVENKPHVHDTPASYAGSDVTPSAAHKLPHIITPYTQPPAAAYHQPPIDGPSGDAQQQQQPPPLTSRPFEFHRPAEHPAPQPSPQTAYPPGQTYPAYAPQQQQQQQQQQHHHHHQPPPPPPPQAPAGHPYAVAMTASGSGTTYMVQHPYSSAPGASSMSMAAPPGHAPYAVAVAPPPGFTYSTHPSYPGYLVATDGMHPGGPPGVVFARSTDPRIVRPKVKLTHEDKRRIVEIARSNTSLRQEDIAQQYGVDRSTISKILISAHRWSGPPAPPVAPPPPKPPKQVGGRFPAVEQRMHEWMDAQHAAGFEVKDNIARDKAKDIAREMGFLDDRFKASSKWLDKFKERRKQLGLRGSVASSFESDKPFLKSADEGVPVVYSDQRSGPSLPFTTTYQGFYSHLAPGQSYSGSRSPGSASMGMLSRSQSSATLASSDSSGVDAYPHSQMQSGRASTSIKSESDMMSLTTSTSDIAVSDALGHHSRTRSRSSPQPLPSSMNGGGQLLEPASGRAPRFSVGGLVRQNSYHSGASPSPRRPTHSLHRSNSSGSSISLRRGTRPTSLAASAFGLTPMQQTSSHSEETSPHPSPMSGTSQHQFHSQPHPGYGHGGQGHPQPSLMAISPGTMSSAGTLSTSSSQNSIAASNGGHLPPLTPLQHQGPYAANPHQQMQPHHQLLDAPKMYDPSQHHVQYYQPVHQHHPHHPDQGQPPPPMHYAYAYAQPH